MKYEVYIKCWYQEAGEQEEVMHTSEHIEDAWKFLKENAENYIENYPLIGMGIR